MGMIGGKEAVLLVSYVVASRVISEVVVCSEDFGERFQSNRTIGIFALLVKRHIRN